MRAKVGSQLSALPHERGEGRLCDPGEGPTCSALPPSGYGATGGFAILAKVLPVRPCRLLVHEAKSSFLALRCDRFAGRQFTQRLQDGAIPPRLFQAGSRGSLAVLGMVPRMVRGLGAFTASDRTGEE